MSADGPGPINYLPPEVLQKDILTYFNSSQAVPCVSKTWHFLHSENLRQDVIELKTQPRSLEQIKERVRTHPALLERLAPFCSRFDFLADILAPTEKKVHRENPAMFPRRSAEQSFARRFLRLGLEFETIARIIITSKKWRKFFSQEDLAALAVTHPSLIATLYTDPSCRWSFYYLFKFAKTNRTVARELYFSIRPNDFTLNYIIINLATSHLSIAQLMLASQAKNKKIFRENWLSLGIAHVEIAEKMLAGEYPTISLPDDYAFQFARAHPTLARQFLSDPAWRRKVGFTNWLALALEYDFVAQAIIDDETFRSRLRVSMWVSLSFHHGFIVKELLKDNNLRSQLTKMHWIQLGKKYEFLATEIMDDPLLRRLITADGWFHLAAAHRDVAEKLLSNREWFYQLSGHHLCELFFQHPTLMKRHRDDIPLHPMSEEEREKLMSYLDGFDGMMTIITDVYLEMVPRETALQFSTGKQGERFKKRNKEKEEKTPSSSTKSFKWQNGSNR